MKIMYLTIKETAEYLLVPEATVESLVQQMKIRTIFDGTQVCNNN
jgi:excisionase family DNA binding protein